MITSSLLSNKCISRDSLIAGKGVFAIEKIQRGELICAWGGKVLDENAMKIMSVKNPGSLKYPICIYDNIYLVPHEVGQPLPPAERFNHSCKPNAGIKGQILLVAREEILPDEEICFDYETTEVSSLSGLPFDCKCQSEFCRKKITGEMWRDVHFQEKNKGFFSWYIEQKILSLSDFNKP